MVWESGAASPSEWGEGGNGAPGSAEALHLTASPHG